MEVWVQSPVKINEDLYLSWLQGFPEDYAAGLRFDRLEGPRGVVLQDTQDQYRIFQMLQQYLMQPRRLAMQTVAQLKADMQQILIEKFVLEIAGKQLSGRLRKDLDDVSKKAGISLFSAWRQFDNVKRIFKLVEDQPGRLEDMISRKFLLQPGLARDYAGLVFICNNRLAMDKKNLEGVYTLRDFLGCAGVFIKHWTSIPSNRNPKHTAPPGTQPGTEPATIEPSGDDQDMERSFLQELRELKPKLLANDVLEELYSISMQTLKQQGATQDASSIAIVFKSVVTSMLQIGAGLSHSRELRDIFEDIVDKVVQPCKSAKCSPRCVSVLFDVLLTSYPLLKTLPQDVRTGFSQIFKRFIEGLCRVTLILYK